MKSIVIEKEARCGATNIPAGEYSVSLRTDSRQISLEGQGREIAINAIGRPNKGIVRSLDVQFVPSGGANTWSLLVKTPKMGEYFSTINYESGRK